MGFLDQYTRAVSAQFSALGLRIFVPTANLVVG